MGVPWYVVCHFSLVAFNILSLSLIFVSLITVYLGAPLWVYPSWDSLSSLSGTPIMQILVHLMMSQRCLSLPSFLFIHFSIFCSVAVISTIPSSRSFFHSSSSVISAIILVYYSLLFVL